MLYAQEHGVFRAYNDMAFERFWRRDLDPESTEAVSAALEQAGAPSGFAAFLDGEGGARHDTLRSEAEASGVFGVPSFVLDGEIFWGGDRVFLLRERLDEKGVPRRR
jgi:2-hydroxychromene-2-carboxylate isomerase